MLVAVKHKQLIYLNKLCLQVHLRRLSINNILFLLGFLHNIKTLKHLPYILKNAGLFQLNLGLIMDKPNKNVPNSWVSPYLTKSQVESTQHF